MFRRFIKFCGQVLLYGCISHCFFRYVGDFVVCNGPSMQPTLQTNNILLTEHIIKDFKRYRRGDIIIAISPTNPRQYICKRIIGLPGDKIIVPIKCSDGSTKEEIDYIPVGSVWVEGDNKQNSSDSRIFGPIPLGLVKSRVILRTWPLSDIKIFNDSSVYCNQIDNDK